MEDTFPPFERYGSIENSYREKEVQYINSIIADNTAEWVALEKIHGCNFSATTDGNTVKWGSRSSYLGDAALGSFNNAIVVARKYADNVKALYHDLKGIYPDITYIRVFGELFGGIYPGVNLPHRYKAIQKGIHYTPDIEFMVFDVKLGRPMPAADAEVEEASNEKDRYDHYLDALDVIHHSRAAGLRCLDVLHRATLAELLQLDPVFQTTIPDILGLPSLPNNTAEGYVIKPLVSVATDRGRVILKHKNPKFAENVSDKTVTAKVATVTEFSEEDEQVFLQMQQYINANRFNAVMSKLTEDRKANHKAVVGLTVKDAMDDIVKDFAATVTPASKGLFHRRLSEYAIAYWEVNCAEIIAEEAR